MRGSSILRVMALAIVVKFGFDLVACTREDFARVESVAEVASAAACIVAHAFLPAESDVIKACALRPALWYLVRPGVEAGRTAGLGCK